MGAWIADSWRALQDLAGEALQIWSSGGWAMGPLALIAFTLFAIGVHVHLRLRRLRAAAVAEPVWRRWIEQPDERSGPIGALLDFLLGSQTVAEAAARGQELQARQRAPVERDLRIMKVCVGGAPLLGLLGTVTGMLSTFDALASGSGGDQTMKLVAGGISEALITTETGLVIALPGLFFQYRLTRRFEQYQAFLAHVESVCTQSVYRRTLEDRRTSSRAAAVARIRAALAQSLAQQQVVS